MSAEQTAHGAETSDLATTDAEPLEAEPLVERTPWETALDAIETSVAEAEELVAPGFLFEAAQVPALALWAPPTGLGPLPAHLEERVLAILDRQADLAPRVEEAARAARTHLRAVGAMRTNDTSAAVYVDALG